MLPAQSAGKHVNGAQHVKIPEQLIELTMKVLTYHCVTARSKAAFHYDSYLWNLQKVVSCQLNRFKWVFINMSTVEALWYNG